MAFYQFKQEQIIDASMEEVWDFISSPMNLKKITPPYMGFDVITLDIPKKMYPGMIIAYKVSPLLGIKTTWVTEITKVKTLEFFIDEQRIGPYKLWHHQHFIEPHPQGVLMKDIISYSPPFGFLGSIANSLIIKSKLKEIFNFRKKTIIEQF
ncbi:MAG: SRPBCC family protein [Flavobacteriaceae bacterium]